MGLKILIVFEFFALLVCLSSAFVFLMKDIGIPESKRTLYALGTRLVLATALVGTIAYGFASGQLKSTAPWDQGPRSAQNIDKDKQAHPNHIDKVPVPAGGFETKAVIVGKVALDH